LQIQQEGNTEADSNLWAQDGKEIGSYTECCFYFFSSSGKWNNLFTAVMILTNSGDSDLAITNMEGYYCKTGWRGLLVDVAI